MFVSRRYFIASSAACVAGGISLSKAQAASAGRSRVFSSAWPLRQIGRELVLGVGYLLLHGTDLDRLIVGLTTGRLQTRLQAMQENLLVEIERPRARVDGQPIDDQVHYFLGVLKEFGDSSGGDAPQLESLGPFVDQVMPVLSRVVATSTLELDYAIRYKRVYVATRTVVRRGHLLKQVDLLCPVGQVNGLRFTVDAREHGGGTCITSSLWLDVCIGRREGVVIRRIAKREIGCREDAMLYKLERLIYDVAHRTRSPDALRRVVPELLRRVETQEIG
jgi:hypothetical protein